LSTISSIGGVASAESAIARLSSSIEKRRLFTATIFMPFDMPAKYAGRPCQASQIVPSAAT